MDCSNCGAPMTLVRAQEYFRCDYCGSFHFPAASKDGVRLLGVAPKNIPCPVCGEALHLASLDDRHHGYQCVECRGLLLERSSFGEAVQSRRSWANGQPDAPRPLDRNDLERRVACPFCRRPMNTHPYYGPGNIVIDTCDGCNMVWLDYGELGRVVNAPGRDRGAALLRREKEKALARESAVKEQKKKRRGEIDLLDLLDGLFSS